MTEYEADSFEHAGIPIKIVYDEDPDDPREWRDSLTVYVWADKNYVAQKHDEQIDLDRFDYRESSWTPVALAARWLTICDGNAIAVPFRIDDYGSNGSQAYLTDTDDDRCTGFIVIRKGELEKELALYPKWDHMAYIKAEFSEFAAWIEGEVYGFIIEPSEDGDDGDSCFGFYGDLGYARSQAKEAAEHIAKDRLINMEPPDVAEVLAR